MKRGSAATRSQKARSAAVLRVVGAGRPVEPDDAAAPQHVVGDDERAIGQPAAVDERVEVAAVFGLERVDEGEVERAGQARVARRERVERRGR